MVTKPPVLPLDPDKPNETIPGGYYHVKIGDQLVPVDCNGQRLDIDKEQTPEEKQLAVMAQKIAELEAKLEAPALVELPVVTPPKPATPPKPDKPPV